MDRQTDRQTDAGHNPVSIAHLEHFVIRWAKKQMHKFMSHTIYIYPWSFKSVLFQSYATLENSISEAKIW